MAQSNNQITRTAHLEWVPIGRMRVSAVAQRDLNQYRVDKLVSEFDPEQLGAPEVNLRETWYYIIDGQHRIAALRSWIGDGWETQKVQCWVYKGLTESEEANRFDRLNDVLAMTAFDKFKVRVTAERPIETDILRTVRTQGLVVSKDKVPGAIHAVGTLTRVYKRTDAETLGRTLRIIRDAYGDSGLEAAVIDGIGHLCQRYNGALDEPTAVTRLSNAHGGVNGLLNKAEVLRKQTGNAKAHCVAAAAVDIINAGKGGKKLPSWWKS